MRLRSSFFLQSKTWPPELPLRFCTFKSGASEEQREWCAPLSSKSHFYSIYIQNRGFCSPPGILQAAMHISFVLWRHWLISVCNDKDPSISSHTDVQFILQKDSCFVFQIEMRKSSIQHCCTVTQRLFWQLYYPVGPNALQYRSRCTEIHLVLARGCRNKDKGCGQMQRNNHIFPHNHLETERSPLSAESSTWF